jgi:hypothetical protein
METNEHSGVYVASIVPLASSSDVLTGQIIFRVSMRITALEQNMHLDIEIPAHSFDEAAQMAYFKLAFLLAGAAKAAEKTSDALLSKLGKTD